MKRKMSLRKITVKLTLVMLAVAAVIGLYLNSAESKADNPYLPLWEHIPDGEPYVFEDPENPGQFRLYVYGSHDLFKTAYCGDDLVVWSAPVENLSDWRYDGVIFEYKGHTLYAPDIAVKTEEDGSKTYYLYPNDQSNNGVVAKADSPVGPFEVCNEKGVLGFDPAVMVDDDGRVYGYWGFQESNMAELDPDTMCTVKDGCKVLKESSTDIDGSSDKEGPYRFFEASSMRKITDNGQTKYAFIYSRKTMASEFDNLGECNATLAYAYSDSPLGPWTYGGTIVDARAREKDEKGKTIMTQPWGNTHGSIVDVNGQWYLFYHRVINEDQYSRQGTVEAVDVSITDDGELKISEVEVTSQGFDIDGLDPYKDHSAGISCYRIGSSYVKATYDQEVDSSPVVNNKKGNIVGYKYFNFKREDWQTTSFSLDILGKGIDGTISVMMDSPWESKGGIEVAKFNVTPEDSKTEVTTKVAETPEIDKVSGKHAIYLVFDSTKTTEIADLCDFRFVLDGEAPPATPSPVPTAPATAVPQPTSKPLPVNTPVPVTASASPVPAFDIPKAVVAGDTFTVGRFTYTVTDADASGKGTVTITGVTSKKLTTVLIGSAVSHSGISYKITAVGKAVFSGMKKLKSVTIGANITDIGSKVFSGCTKLRKVTIKSKVLKKVGAASLKGIAAKCTIKVPPAQYASYKKLLKNKGQKKTVRVRK